MNSNFLSQTLSQFCAGVSATQQYIFPTIQNLVAGSYISEILDVREVLREDGSLEAVDFYHKLTDSSGNVIHVRFRYYQKELASLVSSFKQYPHVHIWNDLIGINEDITVAPKQTGNYMYIASRKSSTTNGVSTSSVASSKGSKPQKCAGGSLRFKSNRSNKLSSAPKHSLLFEDDEFDDWEVDGDDD